MGEGKGIKIGKKECERARGGALATRGRQVVCFLPGSHVLPKEVPVLQLTTRDLGGETMVWSTQLLKCIGTQTTSAITH